MKPVLWVVSAVILFVVVLTVVWLNFPSELRPPLATPTPGENATSSIQAPVAVSEAEEVAAVLSNLPHAPRDGAAADAKTDVVADEALPPGSVIVPDVETWGPDGFGGGTMDVVLSVPGQDDTRFVAVMVHEDGAWKVLGTVEQTVIEVKP